ncbi:MAG TPA: FprA family A-type flavoprotein [Sedimentisphaerales bacterium]|nr:FprA family A-type flavoprotein [Sedimentisphaerales bacterium]
MQYGIPIVKDVYWVGVNDRRTSLFEGIWPIPRGVSYNSYLILDEKTVLIDTVKDLSVNGYLKKLRHVLGPDRQIDYLVVNHLEPDHSGAIPLIRKVFPGIQILGNKKTAEFVRELYGVQDTRIVADGEELSLGRRKLKFFFTPMVHWPETMMTYEMADGILFAGDAFGGFGTLEGGIFDDEVDIHYFEDEILRYFSNIVGKYSPMVQKAIQKLSGAGVPLRIVAATHGPIWRTDPGHIIRLYDRWSRQETEPGVVVAFGSMYGATERMAEAVERGVTEGGIRTIRAHNVSTSHVSYVIRDVWRYQGLILGSPTYDAGMFPLMNNLLDLLREKRVANRVAGLFSSYGWSGGAVKGMRQLVEDNKLELIEPIVDARFCATPEQLEQCHALGRAVAARIRSDAAQKS